MAIENYIEYQRREYCKDVACPIQRLLDGAESNPTAYEKIRAVCGAHCIHTTYEFHHWLIQKGYLVVRPRCITPAEEGKE